MITVDGGYAKMVNITTIYSDDLESVDLHIYAQIYYANDASKMKLLEKLYEKDFVIDSGSKDKVKKVITISPFINNIAELKNPVEQLDIDDDTDLPFF